MIKEEVAIFKPYSPITVTLTSTNTFPIDYKIKLSLAEENGN